MNPVLSLVCYGVRQVLGVDVDDVVGVVETYFTDHSRTLPKALASANDKAWKALGVALAGDGLIDRVKVWFASGDDKGFREQVGRFLAAKGVSYAGSSEEFRKKCLNELHAAMKSKALSADNLTPQDVARQTAALQRYADPPGLLKGAETAVAQVARMLAPQFPNLAQLLGQPAQGGPPLLAAAFGYFFRREIEKDDELAHGLAYDMLKHLSAAQGTAFADVQKALATLGDRFDEAMEQLGRIEVVVVQTQTVVTATHATVLELQVELQRVASVQVANQEEVRRLILEATARLDRAGMRVGEVLPGHSCSIRGEEEKRLVRQMLARFRQLPEHERRQFPALLNGLAKLQLGAGDFPEARATFAEAAAAATDAAAKAEVFFNAYRAALEEKKWPEALEALRQAAALDGARFAPFPMDRYRPTRILGAGGFGTVFHCHDPYLRNREVAVKTLYASDLERDVNHVFEEANVLMELNDPAVIGVLHVDFVDRARRDRPYIVMHYFPGDSLEKFIRDRGCLSPAAVLSLARRVAAGMKPAHERQVLHRDLKPDNLLVRKEGDRWDVKIIDFGLALRPEVVAASQGGGSSHPSRRGESVSGTMKYAPPEQRGDLRVKPGPYSDVYAFGKTWCYALFKTTEPKDRNWRQSPEHERLRPILEKCTDDELQHRYPNFDAVLQDLDRLSPASAAVAVPVPTPPPTPRIDVEALRREGEARLIDKLREVYERTGGRPTEEDNAAFNDLRRRYQVTGERAREIVGQVHQQWRAEQQRRQRESEEQKRRQRKEAAREHAARALKYGENDQMDEAVAAANIALEFDSTSATAYAVRALVHVERNEIDQAFADAGEAVRHGPSEAVAYCARGSAWMRKGDLARAIADLQEAVRLDPKHGLSLTTLGAAQHFAGEQGSAIATLTAAIRVDPKNADAYLGRAECRLWQGNHDLALQDATTALNLRPNAAAYFTRAEAYRAKGEQDFAIDAATKALRIDPTHAGAYFSRAEAHRMKNEHDRAIQDAAAAIHLAPDHAYAHGTRAAAYLARGDHARAIADARKALELQKDYAFAKDVLARAQQAQEEAASAVDLGAHEASASDSATIDPRVGASAPSSDPISSVGLTASEQSAVQRPAAGPPVDDSEFELTLGEEKPAPTEEDSAEFDLSLDAELTPPPRKPAPRGPAPRGPAGSIDCKCPRCGESYHLPSAQAGKLVRCKSCGKAFPVPGGR